MSLNKVMLIGNVGRDPEIRYLEGGAAQGGNSKVATFTLATTERFKDRSGEMRENTEWHNIVAWRQSADVAEKFIRKGTQIYVEGRLRTRSWTDQSGVKKFTTEIVVDNLQLLGKRPDGAPAPQPAYGAPAQGGYQQPYQQPAYQQPTYQQQPYQPRPQQAAPAQPMMSEAPVDIDDAGSDDLPF